jgi:hypothetical protein
MRGKGHECKNILEKATMPRNKTTAKKVTQTRIVETIDDGEQQERANVEHVILFYPPNKAKQLGYPMPAPLRLQSLNA